jgi:hypothetical protein
VGWAVKMGRTSSPLTTSCRTPGPAWAAISLTVLASQPSFSCAGPQAPHPVDLLGGVGEVEVEREGTHQVRGLLDGQGAEEFADLGDDVVRAPRAGGIGAAPGGFLGFLGEQADLLHEVKEFWPVLADQGFAQEGGNAADVCPEFGGKICFWMCGSVSHGSYLSRVSDLARTLRWIL